MTDGKIESPFFTLKEAAQYMRCHPETVRHWLLRGQIKGVKLLKDWRIKKEWLDRFMEFNTKPGRR